MELNDTVWLKIAPSPLHGVGVFAIRDIPKGQKLGCYWQGMKHDRKFYNSLDGLLPEIKELIIQHHPNAVRGDIFPSPNDDVELVCFMNHSDKPNYDNDTDMALRDIERGEEITEDYGEDHRWLLDII